jgi:uncharacterized membrane protein YraQ (UPF0718 family)
MAEDWIAAFCMSSILLNPQLLFYSAALGPVALIIRFVSCFICGALAGLCVRLFFRNKPFFTFTKFEHMASRDTDPNPALRFLKNFGRNVKATGLYFLILIIYDYRPGHENYQFRSGENCIRDKALYLLLKLKKPPPMAVVMY